MAAAKRNLADADLADYADIREDDARRTLRDLGAPVDFILIDDLYLIAQSARET